MDLQITETITKTYKFEWAEFVRTLQSNFRNDKKDRCMKIFVKFLKKYRWELFETYQGYQIITNGYNGFKEIILTDGRRTIKQQELFRRMKKIYNKNN